MWGGHGDRRNITRMPVVLVAGMENPLTAVRSTTFELLAEFDQLDHVDLVLKVRCSPDGDEETARNSGYSGNAQP